MLRQLKLRNFRKHEELVVTFAPGLNAIKGANEAGKTTLLLAALYAWFGSKALPLPLAEIVTWGKKESEVSVELTHEVDGRLYTFTRSKSGAECAYDGGLVTGQTEVSNFAAEVLGADRDLVCRLMLATQSGLKGALEHGPKAVAEMIETLADFDLFDRIMESAEHRLVTGPTAALEERVKQAEARVSAATPEAPDLSEFDAAILVDENAINRFTAEIADREPKKKEAEAKHATAQANQRLRDTLQSNVTKAREALNLHIAQKDDADKKAAVKVNETEITNLKRDLADVQNAVERRRIYGLVVDLMKTYPEAHWEGTKEAFVLDVELATKAVETAQVVLQNEKAAFNAMQRESDRLTSQIVTSTVCPTCGQDLKDKTQIEDRNVELRRGIEQNKADLQYSQREQENYAVTLRNKQGELTDLNAVAKSAAPFERFAMQHGEFLVVDFNFYPPKLSWKGEAPEGDSVEPQAIKDRLVSLESAKEAAERANARSHALAQTIEEDKGHIERLEQQFADCPEAGDLAALLDEARRFGNEIASLQHSIDQCRSRIAATHAKRVEVEAAYKYALAQKEEAEKNLTKTREELDTLNFNNALLKKIRAARPIIGDKLWSMTLSAVSTMFTSMRGEKSVVTKDKDGFAVNGKPVQGLSGSTLDILGLSIRVALIKTFLPHVSFLVLDEPASGCDVPRTASLLGFIASSGFDQTIVVSHEEATEAAADHLIVL